MPTIGPLTETDLNTINEALAKIATAENDVANAKRAGIEVSAQAQVLKIAKAKLLQIKNVYFPGR